MSTQGLLMLDDQALIQSKFQTATDILYRQVENEAILLNISAGIYYSLNETSIYFWDALKNHQPLETAIHRITTDYDIEYGQVLKDLRLFLQDLVEYELISPALENS